MLQNRFDLLRTLPCPFLFTYRASGKSKDLFSLPAAAKFEFVVFKDYSSSHIVFLSAYHSSHERGVHGSNKTLSLILSYYCERNSTIFLTLCQAKKYYFYFL